MTQDTKIKAVGYTALEAELLESLCELVAANDAVQMVLCDGPEVPGFDPSALGQAQQQVTDAESKARAVISKAKTAMAADAGYECEDCIGMKEHGCYCAAMGATAPCGGAF